MFKNAGRQARWFALALAACGPGKPMDTGESASGSSEGPGDSTGGGETTGGPTTGTAPTTGGPGATDSTTEEAPGTTGGPAERVCVPGPTPARRLSNTQYRNTLADLFPGVTWAAELPVEDVRIEGFEHLAEAQAQGPEVDVIYKVAADQVAAAVAEQGAKVLPCAADGGPDPAGCGHAYLQELGPRAFRRPLTDAEAAALLEVFDATLAGDDFPAAIRAAVAGVLASPNFLLLEGTGGAPLPDQPDVIKLDGFAVAARLSYFLWDSTPDAQLMQAAGEGTLDEPAGLEKEARRLLDDPRGHVAVARLVRRWLYLHALDGEALPESVPAELGPSMRAEVDAFVEHVVFGGQPTLAALLGAPVGFPDAALAKIYEVPAPNPEFALTELDPARRPGLLTRIGWLGARALASGHSPFQRGWRLQDSLFCVQLPPPPPDIDIVPPEPVPDATTRERYDTILAEPACAGCHVSAHGLGYGLENYDAIGRWQDSENGKPVDAGGEVAASLDPDVAGPFSGAAELASKLAASRVVHDCTARKATMAALGRTLGDADACSLAALQEAFFAGGDLHELLVRIVLSDGFRHRLAE